MERARDAFERHANQLHDAGDYDAEFPAEDADRMREGVALLRLIQRHHPDTIELPTRPEVLVIERRRSFWDGFWDGLGLGPLWRRIGGLPREVRWFARDVAGLYCLERREGAGRLGAAGRAVFFAATCPF